MPNRVGLRATLSQVRGDHGPKVVHPAQDSLVEHRDPALGEQVFDVSQAEGEPQIQPNRLANDLGRESVAGVADFPHAVYVQCPRAVGNQVPP